MDTVITLSGSSKIYAAFRVASIGNFMRSFRIPDDADESAVKAEFKDGMISVTLPKYEKAKSKPKAIEVKVS